MEKVEKSFFGQKNKAGMIQGLPKGHKRPKRWQRIPGDCTQEQRTRYKLIFLQRRLIEKITITNLLLPSLSILS